MFYHLADMKSSEVDTLDREKTIVILPVGAMEQHGAHLPIGTDTQILQGVLGSFEAHGAAELDVLLLPTISVGKSNEHMAFAGTLTYSLTTLIAIIRDMASSVARHGFKKLVLFNAHGGNTDVLNAVARDIRDDFGVRPFVIDWWFTSFWSEILQTWQESPRDGVFHACELETSLMLALHPDLVDMSKAIATFPPQQMRENEFVTVFGPVNMGWVTKDITKSGVVGDPTKATAQKGEAFLEYAGKKLTQIFGEIAAIPQIEEN